MMMILNLLVFDVRSLMFDDNIKPFAQLLTNTCSLISLPKIKGKKVSRMFLILHVICFTLHVSLK